MTLTLTLTLSCNSESISLMKIFEWKYSNVNTKMYNMKMKLHEFLFELKLVQLVLLMIIAYLMNNFCAFNLQSNGLKCIYFDLFLMTHFINSKMNPKITMNYVWKAV